MDKVQKPSDPSVIHHRQNPLESAFVCSAAVSGGIRVATKGVHVPRRASKQNATHYHPSVQPEKSHAAAALVRRPVPAATTSWPHMHHAVKLITRGRFFL
jgi:hypothetical protein